MARTVIARAAISAVLVVSILGATDASALDHFTCYRSRTASGTPKFVPRTDMQLHDRFGEMSLIFFAYERLCAPASVDGGDPTAPMHPDHLAAYQQRNEVPHFARVHGLTVTNAFGTIVVDLTKPVRVMVPSAKSVTAPPAEPDPPGIDHFTCYKLRASPGSPAFTRRLGVALTDQFGTVVVDVKKPKTVCVPTDKNDESPGAESHPDALACYAVARAKGTPAFATVTPVYLANQLGPSTITVRKPSELCVPSSVTP